MDTTVPVSERVFDYSGHLYAGYIYTLDFSILRSDLQEKYMLDCINHIDLKVREKYIELFNYVVGIPYIDSNIAILQDVNGREYPFIEDVSIIHLIQVNDSFSNTYVLVTNFKTIFTNDIVENFPFDKSKIIRHFHRRLIK